MCLHGPIPLSKNRQRPVSLAQFPLRLPRTPFVRMRKADTRCARVWISSRFEVAALQQTCPRAPRQRILLGIEDGQKNCGKGCATEEKRSRPPLVRSYSDLESAWPSNHLRISATGTSTSRPELTHLNWVGRDDRNAHGSFPAPSRPHLDEIEYS